MSLTSSSSCFQSVFADPEEREGRALFFPSIGEYPIYDELAYEAMMADLPRVQAFSTALEAHVRPDSVVVELGCGRFAPWARMAARLGAAHVVAVESLPEAREQALDSIVEEGLGGRIDVVSPEDYARMAFKKDLIIAEIIGTIGSSEGVEKALTKEIQNCDPGTVIFPQFWEAQVRPYSVREFCAGLPPAFVPDAEEYLDSLRALGIVQPRLSPVGPYISDGFVADPATLEKGTLSGKEINVDYCTATIEFPQDTSFDSILFTVRVGIGDNIVDSGIHETSWYPVMVPFEDGEISVFSGDSLRGRLSTSYITSQNVPDYFVSWEILTFCDEIRVSGEYELPWLASEKRSNPLHNELLRPSKESDRL